MLVSSWHRRPQRDHLTFHSTSSKKSSRSMIRIDNISKSNSHRILFIEASAALNRGEKIGLVGPNGAGKTTLFRMITGDEQPDEGQVSVEKV